MFLIMATEDPGFALAQSALSSSSVFNFFRPGYVKPGSQSASALLLAPELQIATETSSAGYVNYLMYFLRHGTGLNGYDRKAPRSDVQLLANIDPAHALLTLADKPADLVEEINQRLMYGTMPLALKTEIVGAVQSVGAGVLSNLSVEKITENRRRRLWSALLLTMASPEFQIQK
jgi:hypothetical protein